MCGQNITTIAIEKIKKETENFKGGIYAKAVHQEVSETLINFCEQNIQLADVVAKTKRTLSDCCEECVKEVKNGKLSDLEVYKRAVSFYFPNSEVSMIMAVKLGEAPGKEYINKEPEVKKADKPKTVTKEKNVKTDTSSKKKTINAAVKAKKTKNNKEAEGQLLLFDLM